jgi:hypothetical protein
MIQIFRSLKPVLLVAAMLMGLALQHFDAAAQSALTAKYCPPMAEITHS